MNRLTQTYHPTHRRLFREYPIPYYWSVEESEWATDVVFRSPQTLAQLYPRLVRQALTDVPSADVMRFLGRRMPKHGGVSGHFQGEVLSEVRTRREGTRVQAPAEPQRDQDVRQAATALLQAQQANASQLQHLAA